MEKIMKDKLLAIADQFQMTSFERSIKDILSLNSVKIAFLGAYSAGKTSLINAMLGLKLPVSDQPTTKSICLIEPTEGISSNEYFQDVGLTRENISFSQFQDLLDGSKEGVAGVRIKPSDHLPLGSVFIDTPGIDNTGSSEGDLTTAYLQFIDAAVICIDVKDGTLKNHILQYLQRPELTSIRDKMIFVLTQVNPERGEHAYDNVIREVSKQIEKGLKISNASSKIIAIDSSKADAPDKVLELLKENIFVKRNSAIQNRITQSLKTVAQEMLQLLKLKRDNFFCNTTEIDKKIQKVKDLISTLEEEIYNHRNDLENLKEDLYNAIKRIMKGYVSAFSSLDGDSLQDEINNMQESINTTSQSVVNNYIKNCALNKAVTNACMNDLVAKFKSVDDIKNTAVTVSTAAIVAYFFPAASVVGNTAEAVGGGAIQIAAKEAAKEAAKKTGKEVVKNTAKSYLSKVLADSLKTIDKANPIQQVGTLIASKFKSSNFEDVIPEKAKSISNMVVTSVQVTYDSEVIQPLSQQLEEQLDVLERLKEEKKTTTNDFQKQVENLDETINELKKII